MACFLITTAEAIVTTVISKRLEHNYNQVSNENQELSQLNESGLPFYKKLKWLSSLLWGGSTLLAFEHVWHGEVTPWFPFLTAMSTPENTQSMLHEMSTVGVSMALVVTTVWCGMLLLSKIFESKLKTNNTLCKQEN